MTIRKIEKRDEEQVFLLARDLATSFQVDRQGFSKNLISLINKDGGLFVAEIRDQIVGYVLGDTHLSFYAGKVAIVEELMVSDTHRGGGVGRKLMETFEDWAKKEGAKLVSVCTRRAGDFYKKVGYEQSAIYFRKVF